MLRALVALALAALGIAPTEAPARGSLDARLSHLEERVAALVPHQYEEGVHEKAVFAMGSACAAMNGARKTRLSKPGKFKNKCATCKAGCQTDLNGQKCQRWKQYCEPFEEPPRPSQVCAKSNADCPTCIWKNGGKYIPVPENDEAGDIWYQYPEDAVGDKSKIKDMFLTGFCTCGDGGTESYAAEASCIPTASCKFEEWNWMFGCNYDYYYYS